MQLRRTSITKMARGGLDKGKLTKEKRVPNSLNLQVQPKPAKGVRTWDMSNRVGEISQEQNRRILLL
jgi:hypothetical protein